MERKDPGSQLIGHVVICNVSPKLRTIVEELHRVERDMRIVVIVQDEALYASNPTWHPGPTSAQRVTEIHGCPTDQTLLGSAMISRARAAVILADPLQGEQADARSALVAVAIEQANPQVHTVMELLLSANLKHLRATEVNEVICLGEIAEKLVAQSCVTPGSSRIFSHLLTTARDTSQIFLEPVPGHLVGETFRSVALAVIDSGIPAVVCGFVLGASKDAGSGRARQTLVLNPRPGADPGRDTALGAPDRLVVISTEAGALGSVGPS